MASVPDKPQAPTSAGSSAPAADEPVGNDGGRTDEPLSGPSMNDAAVGTT